MRSAALRAPRPESRRPTPDLRVTLDSIADEILARLDDVMAHQERHGNATVIISGEAPMASARDAGGWSTRIVRSVTP